MNIYFQKVKSPLTASQSDYRLKNSCLSESDWPCGASATATTNHDGVVAEDHAVEKEM
jgi:hypothetical protein